LSVSFLHIIGLLFTIILISIIGAWSGNKVKNASDFATGGGKAGTWIVCGAIMGTLVSGQATIGTAQLAFSYGISAWWFTLGSGLGCLILAVAYVYPLRHTGSTTLLEVVSKEYGKKAESIGSILCFIGMFISIVAQVLAASALLTAIFPMKPLIADLISIGLMTVYVIFGGVWGAGLGGIVKLVLLYASSIVGGIAVWGLSKGYSGLIEALEQIFLNTDLGKMQGLTTCELISQRYQNLLARGTTKDLGSCLSLIMGVLSTQTYAQGIWSAKTDSSARKASMLCALLTPPIGIACILIGLFMRGHYITLEESVALASAGQSIPDEIRVIASSSQVFPLFIINHLPKLIGGIALGTLFVTIVGGGSGLSLGAATILVRDVFSKLSTRFHEAKANLIITRLTIVSILLASVVVSYSMKGTFINDLGFLSMGLRATAVFLPLSFSLFLPKRIKPQWVLISMIAGTAVLLFTKFYGFDGDPMYYGLTTCLLCSFLGYRKKNTH
jgi:Na+/proline symporter